MQWNLHTLGSVRLSSLQRSTLGPQMVSFVESIIIMFSSQRVLIGGSTVLLKFLKLKVVGIIVNALQFLKKNGMNQVLCMGACMGYIEVE